MRQLLSLGAFLGILVTAGQVSAQQAPGSFTATNPRPLNFQAVDTSQMSKVMNLSNTLRTPTKQQAFSLANVFRGFPMPTWPPRIATSTVLSPSQNIFQPNQNPGLNFFPTTAAYPTTNNPYIITKAWN